MIDLIIDYPHDLTDLTVLDGDLRLALGALVLGVSTAQGQIIVHLAPEAGAAEAAQARAIIEALPPPQPLPLPLPPPLATRLAQIEARLAALEQVIAQPL
jgi:hypothetical protein